MEIDPLPVPSAGLGRAILGVWNLVSRVDAAEARAWVLDRQVLSCSIYEGDGDLREASAFVARCARELPVPETSVVDVALVEDR